MRTDVNFNAELAKKAAALGASAWVNEALSTGNLPTIADDKNMVRILQDIDGEHFEWWLHILHDGQVQALWQEAITGAVNSTQPKHPDYYSNDMRLLGIRAAALRRELILTVDDVEYRVEYHMNGSIVSWLDVDSGAELKARIKSDWISPGNMPLEDILNAVNTPEARVV